MKQKLENALEKGLSFFLKNNWCQANLEQRCGTHVLTPQSTFLMLKTVFITAVVLHSLKHIDNFLDTKRISQKAIDFLLNEMESYGLWRFYGNKSKIHFDIDDTCVVLASLKEMKVEMNYESITSHLLAYRNNEKIFETWILDVNPPFKKMDNNVDWVVNANALFLYSLLNKNMIEIEQYLTRIVKKEIFKKGSLYYPSPFCFIYFFTRAYADGHNPRIIPAITNIRNYLRTFIGYKFSNNPLENAFGTVSLLNCNKDSIGLKLSIQNLLNLQRKDGSWPNAAAGEDFYNHLLFGSEELTTAISLEAISKYLKKIA